MKNIVKILQVKKEINWWRILWKSCRWRRRL